MDVFEGWQDYVQKLEKNWRAVVSEEDTVVIAGDISWAMRLEETEKDFAFIHSLPGKKWLLKGNHDYWWSTRKKIDAFLAEKGFDSIGVIHNSAVLADGMGRLNASIDDGIRQGGDPVVFLHYPPVYDGAECREILDVLVKRGIKTCYFGHIHGSQAARRAITGEYAGIKMVLISCDHLKFLPLLVRGE